MTLKAFLTLMAALWAVSFAQASKPDSVSRCPANRPALFDEIRSPLAKAALPEKVLLAREANLWVEDARSGLKIWARHNFKTGKKSFVCANLPPNTDKHLSVPLIVLWDRTPETKIGDSLWQMQVMANKSKLGLWSQKTGLMSVGDLLNARQSPWKIEFTDGVLDETILRSVSRQGDLNLTAVIRLDHADHP